MVTKNTSAVRALFTLAGIVVAQNAMAGSLVANFNVSGPVPAVPSWYDNGVLANTPSNNPNTTINFTFGKGANPLQDSSGNLVTDTRHEAVTNPSSIITVKTFTVTIPSGCTIGGANSVDIGNTVTVDSAISINIGGTKFTGANTDISAQSSQFMYTASNSLPSATSGATVFLNLALGTFYPATSNSGSVACNNAGNFTLTF